MRRRVRDLTLTGCVWALAWGCGGGPAPAGDGLSGRLILTGSSTVAPVATEIGRHFEARHPGVRVDVQAGGSGRGIADIRSGAANIGMASRALARDETDLVAHPIGFDGVGLILNSANPVSKLSDAEVVGIYTGRLTNWAEVGGRDARIIVAHKAEGRATLEVFLDYFRLDNRNVSPDVVIGDNQQGIKTVAGNVDAIGYVSIGAAEHDIDAGVPIKLLSIGGIDPTSDAVARGDFPISRPLNLLTAGPPDGLARAFIEFATSSEMREVIRDQYFVPVRR